jgi:membrane protein DedA with SNARE-associated domain
VTPDDQTGDDQTGDANANADDSPIEREPVPRHGPIWVVLFVALVVCTNVANTTWSALEKSHPAKLILLSARNRFLVVAVPQISSWALWAFIGTVRLLAAAVVCHMIGRCYGDRALRWFWRFLGMPQEQVAKFEEQIAKAEWFIVPFFVGSNIVWALTGAAKTTWKRLLPFALIGIALRLALLWWLAKTFERQLRSIIDWTSKYSMWIIIGSLVVVVVVNVRNFRAGRA